MKRDLFLCTFAEDALNIIKEFGIGMESNHFCISERLDDHVVEETISEVNRVPWLSMALLPRAEAPA